MSLWLATVTENVRANSPPDSGGVARRAPRWLFPKVQDVHQPPLPLLNEEGSYFHNAEADRYRASMRGLELVGYYYYVPARRPGR